MKTVTIDTELPQLGSDPAPLVLAQYITAYLYHKQQGAVYAKWDENDSKGTWFYSTNAGAIFETPQVNHLIFHDTDRARFRSVIFRIGSLASDTGDLCGVVRLLPQDQSLKVNASKRYVIHASFHPDAGLWLKAAVVTDDA